MPPVGVGDNDMGEGSQLPGVLGSSWPLLHPGKDKAGKGPWGQAVKGCR